jgi:hypothetical protein
VSGEAHIDYLFIKLAKKLDLLRQLQKDLLAKAVLAAHDTIICSIFFYAILLPCSAGKWMYRVFI